MPFKERRERERTKAREKAELDALVQQRPPHIVIQQGPTENLFAEATQGYLAGLVQFDENGDPHLHKNVGKGGNDRRHADMRDDIQELKSRFPELWFTRSGAKQIAPQTANILGREKNLSVRTIQKYQKLDRENARPR